MPNKLQVEYVSIDDIKTYENNAKLHPAEQIEQIKESIKEFGFNDPIAIDKDNVIIEGHGRYIACKELGINEVPIIRLNELSDEQKRAYMLVHNKLTMNTDFDIELLNDELENIFDIDMSKFDFSIEQEIDEEEVEEVDIPEVEEVTSKLGDIYQLGNHRVMCGDSTKGEDIEKLMKGNTFKCMFTSPPYNMGADLYKTYEDNLKSEEYIEFNLKVINEWKKYLRGFLFWNISYNKNTRWEFIEILYRIVKETGLKYMELIVWDKGHGLPIVTKDMLTRQYEDILMVGDEENISQDMEMYYLGTTEKRAYMNKKKGKGITNYWRINTGNTQIEKHKACFPIGLPARAVTLTTDKEDIVVDCFGGSGSTLIACEQLGRKCYTMELDPYYVDVIVKRWEQYTGEKAIKIND